MDMKEANVVARDHGPATLTSGNLLYSWTIEVDFVVKPARIYGFGAFALMYSRQRACTLQCQNH